VTGDDDEGAETRYVLPRSEKRARAVPVAAVAESHGVRAR